MKRVYILGEARGVYRVQSLIKLLIDNRKEYKVYYDSIFYSNFVLRYLKSIFINPFVILRSNIVYVCTLNVDLNIFYELIWAKLLRKKVIVDFYVSVYDTVVLDRKWFKEGTFLSYLAKVCDRMFLRLGDIIIFLTQTEHDYYLKLSGRLGEKMNYQIIPIGVEERFKSKSNFISGLSDTLNICWWGTYIPLHGLDTLLKAAKITLDRGIPVNWFFFGNDSEKGKEYVEKANLLGISEICKFSDEYTFSNGKLQEFLEKNCDVALGPFGDSNKSKNVLSNKFLEACSMRCIVLTGKSEAVDEFFGNDETNVFTCERTPFAIADKINDIYKADKIYLQHRVDNIYEYYKKNFTIDKLTQRMKNVIDTIMKNKNVY